MKANEGKDASRDWVYGLPHFGEMRIGSHRTRMESRQQYFHNLVM